MNAYSMIGRRQTIAMVVLANVIGIGALELVSATMRYPDDEAKAARERSLIAACERIEQIRMLEQREMMIATADTGAAN